MNYRYDWLFDDYFFQDEFRMEKTKIGKELEIIIYYLKELSTLNYIDENISKFIDDLYESLEAKLQKIEETTSITGLREIYNIEEHNTPDYILESLRSNLISGFFQNYTPILNPDINNLNSKALELNKTISEKNFSLTDYESFDNYKRLFRFYISVKRNFDDTLENERRKFLDSYYEEISSIKESTRKLNSYIKFESIFEKIIEEKKTSIFNYVYSNNFIKSTLNENETVLNKKIVELCKELNTKSVEINKFINYMAERMKRLKDIAPKNMTFEEEILFYKLRTTANKTEFDKIYSIIYTMFTNHKYDDKKIINNFKTKKKLNIIKRKVDDKYYLRVKPNVKVFTDIRDIIKNYIYFAVQKVFDDNSISLETKALSDLTFYDFIKDLRLINESLNENYKVSDNHIYIPRLDNKEFNRNYSYSLLELSFEYENIGINELTKNVMQDGDLDMNYNTFLYQYMSINTYVKKTDYIGKDFLVNDFHNNDSQDFSNSKLLLNYNGILLIENNGEYEVVSHETVTMAGYDIPEPDKLKQNTIESYKKEILINIINAAESFRDKYSSSNYEKTLR